MLREKLKSREGFRFIICVSTIFLVALAVLLRATIGGVIEEYNLPLSQWSTGMYFLQGAMVLLYTLIITVFFSLPLAIFFFGKKDNE